MANTGGTQANKQTRAKACLGGTRRGRRRRAGWAEKVVITAYQRAYYYCIVPFGVLSVAIVAMVRYAHHLRLRIVRIYHLTYDCNMCVVGDRTRQTTPNESVLEPRLLVVYYG